MIDYLRTKVSGKKIRYQENGYNLDLSYITPRIIAMSLPGEGFRKVYRNSIDSVSDFLKERHQGRFRVLNLSGLKYNYEKFDNKVYEFFWEDHYPPPLDLIFQACQNIHYWLSLKPDNIIAVNCKAGKGRTGTLICCYMIYCGRLESPQQALKYYKSKRFFKGGGVTQPSQIRYIEYFADIFFQRIKTPIILQLVSVQIRTAPHISGNSFKPVFEVVSDDTLRYTNKKITRERQTTINDTWENPVVHDLDVINMELLLQGDVQCFLSHWGILGLHKICRFTFNTAFVPCNYSLVLEKYEIDPDSFKHNKKASDNFAFILNFKPLCCCSSRMEFIDRCIFCKRHIEYKEREKWEIIKEVLKEKIRIDPKVSLFSSPELDDIDEILSHSFEDSEESSNGSIE
jgi:phosphatidylinositol-3,4,5-trisphosphate 3-phosphatase and dual-specificity protein phosphatase PTEN